MASAVKNPNVWKSIEASRGTLSMWRDLKAYLWDDYEAVDAILKFTSGRNLEYFQYDLLLRSAVERQFEIIGSALNQLNTHNHDVANRTRCKERVPDGLRQFVSPKQLL